MKKKFYCLCMGMLLGISSVEAKVTLPSIISDNMVLQAQTKSVYGVRLLQVKIFRLHLPGMKKAFALRLEKTDAGGYIYLHPKRQTITP